MEQVLGEANEDSRGGLDEGYSIPENRYVFSSLMGQSYAYFKLDDDLDDPRFYRFHEDDGVVTMSPTSFIEMLEKQADSLVRRMKKERLR